jgi:hypothetical protein
MIDLIANLNVLVPALDHDFIHFFQAIKLSDFLTGEIGESQDVSMVEMCIRSYPNVRH